MKNILLITFLLLTYLSSFSQHGRPANELFDEAIAKAKKEKKNVFVIFTATWCAPCKYLKRGLCDDYNVQYFDRNYVILELYSSYVDRKKGLANEGANKLLAQYKGDTTAVPYWLIVNPLRKKLHGQLDFSGDVPDLKIFVAVLKKTSRLNQSELEMILERFRQIALLIPED
jgi:thioredoxin-related protein